MPDEAPIRYTDRYLRVYGDRDVFDYLWMADGVIIVPLTAAGEVIFIHEHSFAYDREGLWLPMGMLEPDEAPEVSANRELQEEIGYKAGRIDRLGVVCANEKYIRMTDHLYLARDLTPSKLDGDESHPITPERVALADVDGLIASGRVRDAVCISALFLARDFLRNGGG